MGLLDIFSSIRDRVDKFLNEKNVVTDFLGKMEEKTGIRKKIIAGGMWAAAGHSAGFMIESLWMILSSASLYSAQFYLPVAC